MLDGKEFHRYGGSMDYIEQWNRNRVDWLYQLARCGEIGSASVRLGLYFGTFLLAEQREEVKPSYARMCKETHMARATLAKAINELEEEGFLRIDRFHAETSYYSMPFEGDKPWKRVRKKDAENALSSKNELRDI